MTTKSQFQKIKSGDSKAFEALFGAIYLDPGQGIEKCKELFYKWEAIFIEEFEKIK